MTKPVSYNIQAYGAMIVNEPRIQAYIEALTRSIFPGCIVLDIGAGTGVFSLLACQLGAGKVYAVEPDDSIHVARSIAADNGFSDRISFLKSISTEIEITKRADVVISDLRSVLPLFQNHIPSIIDARTRLMAPGGCLIPQSDDLYGALVESSDLYRVYEEPWVRNSFGLDMRAGRRYAINFMRGVKIKSEQLLVTKQHLATIDYTKVESPDIRSKLSWTIERDCTCHGLAVWFDASLAEGVSFSNAPGQPELIYGQAFFPWQEAVKLEAGDDVVVEIEARLINGEYIWLWSTEVMSGGNTKKTKHAFKQSTFFATPFSPENLRKQELSYMPSLNSMGEIDFFLLSLMNGENELEEIASQATEQFPDHFRSLKDALDRVKNLSGKFS